jgi:hypothetical protein
MDFSTQDVFVGWISLLKVIWFESNNKSTKTKYQYGGWVVTWFINSKFIFGNSFRFSVMALGHPVPPLDRQKLTYKLLKSKSSVTGTTVSK